MLRSATLLPRPRRGRRARRLPRSQRHRAYVRVILTSARTAVVTRARSPGAVTDVYQRVIALVVNAPHPQRLVVQEVQVLPLAEHLLPLEPRHVPLDAHARGALRSNARQRGLRRFAEEIAALRLRGEGPLEVREVDGDAVDHRVPQGLDLHGVLEDDAAGVELRDEVRAVESITRWG